MITVEPRDGLQADSVTVHVVDGSRRVNSPRTNRDCESPVFRRIRLVQSLRECGEMKPNHGGGTIVPYWIALECSIGCGRKVGQDGVFVAEGVRFCRQCALRVRGAIDAWVAV